MTCHKSPHKEARMRHRCKASCPSRRVKERDDEAAEPSGNGRGALWKP